MFTNCKQENIKVEEVILRDSIVIKKIDNYKHVLNLPSGLRTFIFPETANIYAAPDTLSEVVRELKFSDSQYTVQEHILNEGIYWYKLQGWNPDFKEGGYIKANVMSNFYTSYSKLDLGILGKIITKSNNEGAFSIKLFNTKTNKILQKYTIPHYYDYHVLENLYESEHALEGINYIFNYRTEEESCPGRSHQEIIVTTKNKLIKLWSSDEVEYEENDELEDQIFTLYIPIVTANKVVLAPWGKFKDILKNDLTFDIVEPSSSINIPVRNLVVLKTTKVYSKNIKKISFKYYKWNGSKLIFIKEIEK